MRQSGTIVAARPLARHSELLATRPPEAGELAKALAARATRLESALADELADLLGGMRARVTCGKVDRANVARLLKVVDAVAANFQLAGDDGVQVLASIDYHGALVLTDQVFGGAGEWSAARPVRLPASVDLTLQRIGDVLGKALSASFDLAAPMALASRNDVLGKLVSPRDSDSFLTLRAEIAVADAQPWSVLLAVREAHAAKLLDEQPHCFAAPGAGDRRRPDAKPFAAIPLPLTAVLARMDMPVSRISDLRPGDTIPLAIGRSVALKLAETEIARGEVGTCDGALALRLTSIAWNSLSKGHEQ
ncbi:flagellar motor switch protein FliM [Aurantiacibacter zhengii]|uniref:Flagellar motor switch protein FliM n=1 Tax=Aurantiacibacter zhengii TaxID=2307003 RepID=A0A418NRT1_9SPHN|nr:flagellar motor switch protein FliM [Aurantiacibacter zhengii]RIV85793.1 flagellar motor switch protein FliM [Aurantiacibacter zhengii]